MCNETRHVPVHLSQSEVQYNKGVMRERQAIRACCRQEKGMTAFDQHLQLFKALRKSETLVDKWVDGGKKTGEASIRLELGTLIHIFSKGIRKRSPLDMQS
jgi:hypothetical protein